MGRATKHFASAAALLLGCVGCADSEAVPDSPPAGTSTSAPADAPAAAVVEDVPAPVRPTSEPAPPEASPPEPPAALTQVEPPPSLEEVYSGRVERFQHPRGWYGFDLPRGWSIAAQGDDHLLVNPGLREGDTLDALLMVTHGELDSDERNLPVEQLFQRNRSKLRSVFRELGLRMETPDEDPTRVLAGEVPGAQQLWSGRTEDGEPVNVWVAAVVQREYFLVVLGLAVEARTAQYLPGFKRVFTSLTLTPPERNPRLEALLAGRRVSHNDTTTSGSSSYFYTFGEGGTVRKEILISFANTTGLDVSGGSTEESGRYEVIGDEVYLYFGSGQESGVVVLEGNVLAGVRFGSTLYKAR